jgi:hypothetical protein
MPRVGASTAPAPGAAGRVATRNACVRIVRRRESCAVLGAIHPDLSGTPIAISRGMGAAMIPIVLVICTVLLGVVAGWQPFGGFVGLVVLALFAFIVGGLISLIGRLEHSESPDR